MSLFDLCVGSLKRSVHPLVKVNMENKQNLLEKINTTLVLNELYSNSNLINGRYPLTGCAGLTGIGLRPIDDKLTHSQQMVAMQRPEGIASCVRLAENKNGKDCIILRVDDFNHLDFWMEIAIPIDEIEVFLKKNSKKREATKMEESKSKKSKKNKNH